MRGRAGNCRSEYLPLPPRATHLHPLCLCVCVAYRRVGTRTRGRGGVAVVAVAGGAGGQGCRSARRRACADPRRGVLPLAHPRLPGCGLLCPSHWFLAALRPRDPSVGCLGPWRRSKVACQRPMAPSQRPLAITRTTAQPQQGATGPDPAATPKTTTPQPIMGRSSAPLTRSPFDSG